MQAVDRESRARYNQKWDACFLGLGTLILDLYMFSGPGRIFFWTWGHKKCRGRACVFSGPCGDIFLDLHVFVLDPGQFF